MKYNGWILLFFLAGCSSAGNKKAAENKITSPSENQTVTYYPANTSPLEKEEKTITLRYITWGCECANWVEDNKYTEYDKKGALKDHTIFIEPASDKLVLPDTLGYNADLLQFTGRFYSQKGYPKNYIKTEEQAEPAYVFQYTAYKVIRSKYVEFRKIEIDN